MLVLQNLKQTDSIARAGDRLAKGLIVQALVLHTPSLR